MINGLVGQKHNYKYIKQTSLSRFTNYHRKIDTAVQLIETLRFRSLKGNCYMDTRTICFS